MPTARSIAYAVASGSSVFAGGYGYGSDTGPFAYWTPLTTPTLPPTGHTGAIGTSTLYDGISANATEQFQMTKVLGAWNGAQVSVLKNYLGETVDVLYWIVGGGHNDTGWDGVTVWRARTRAFESALGAATYGSKALVDATYGEDTTGGDGKTRLQSHHTYGHLVGLDSDDANGPALVVTRRGACASNSVNIHQTHRFDWATKAWVRCGANHAVNTNVAHVALKDKARNRVIRTPSAGNGTAWYSGDYTNAALPWTAGTQGGRPAGWGDTNIPYGVIDPVSDLLIQAAFIGTSPGLYAQSAADPSGTWTLLTTTGDALPTSMIGCAMVYRSAGAGSLLLVDATSTPPTALWEIVRPASSPLTNAWTVTRRTFAGTSAFAPLAGVPDHSTRWQYVAAWDCLIACPNPTAPMEAWRL